MDNVIIQGVGVQSWKRNPNLKLITRNGSLAVPAGAVGVQLAVTTDPIPIPPDTRFHLWLCSLQMMPHAAGDAAHVDLVGGALFSFDLYESEDPATYVTSVYLGFPPGAIPMRIYVATTGNAFGQSAAGDDALLEIPANMAVQGDVRGAIRAVGLSTAIALTNTDAANPHTIDATLAHLYSVEQ